ncbi:hypothetical protein [Nonomuraea sp. NPDC050786]|uniref:hypothetical protein n=1 Tax=Nonomuraea sp. NPDC050786 TaxID=3154840 RepID=UPI00340161DF
MEETHDRPAHHHRIPENRKANESDMSPLDYPIARQDPRLDITDLHVFRAKRSTSLGRHALCGSGLPVNAQADNPPPNPIERKDHPR